MPSSMIGVRLRRSQLTKKRSLVRLVRRFRSVQSYYDDDYEEPDDDAEEGSMIFESSLGDTVIRHNVAPDLNAM